MSDEQQKKSKDKLIPGVRVGVQTQAMSHCLLSQSYDQIIATFAKHIFQTQSAFLSFVVVVIPIYAKQAIQFHP